MALIENKSSHPNYCCLCDSIHEGKCWIVKLPNPIDTSQNEMDACKTYKIVGIEKALAPSVFEKEIWNEAIEAAAALIGEQNHGSYCEEIGNEIRKLKK